MPRFDIEIHLTGWAAVLAWIYFTVAAYGGLMRLLEDLARLFRWMIR